MEAEWAEHRNHTWFASSTSAAFQQPSVLVLFIWKVASSAAVYCSLAERHWKLPPVLTDESSGKVVLQDSLQFLLTWWIHMNQSKLLFEILYHFFKRKTAFDMTKVLNWNCTCISRYIAYGDTAFTSFLYVNSLWPDTAKHNEAAPCGDDGFHGF